MFVLDASATMPFLFEQEADDQSRLLQERMFTHGVYVPSLWFQEVSNTILTAYRRGRIAEADINRHLRDVLLYPIEVDVLHHSIMGSAVVPIARSYNLTVYDATYVELAMRLDLPLASRDAKMRAAATQMGLELFAV